VTEVGRNQGKTLRNNFEEEVMEDEHNLRKLNRNSRQDGVMEGWSGWKKSKSLTGEVMEIRINQEKLNRESLIEEVTKKKSYLVEEVAEK
jgi:carbamoylphosphate synthase small subunit